MPGKPPHFVKYNLHFQMRINGFVEKNDIIGAIFGQLEGILPPELDPQNLLNTGRIGRIEVSLTHREGKTFAEIIIPCSLNKVEASILAAAVETINKIGPATAETKLDHIENILEERRKQIIDRASEILGGWYNYEKTEIQPESIPRLIEEKARKTKMITVGPEKLPAGVGILKSDEILIVEGRADVVNLIKHGYDNVVAVGGSGTIPKTIVDLAKKKMATAFVDGDRAGLLLLKSLLQAAEIDYITVAPKGKEVEELTYKEIKHALDHKIPTKNLSLDIDRLEYLIEEYIGRPAEKVAKPEDIDLAIEALLDKIAGSKKFIAVNENFEEIISGNIALLEKVIDYLSGTTYAVLLDIKPSGEILEKLRSVGVDIVAYRGKNDKIEIINLQKLAEEEQTNKNPE
ncbi:MAG: DNA primase DnaG [Candidatus Njordarchaeota archaeon]